VSQSEADIVGHDRKDDLIVRILEHETHLLPDRPGVARRVQARNLHRARYGQYKSVQKARQRALAGTVSTDHADTLFGQAKRDILQDRAVMQGDADVVEVD